MWEEHPEYQKQQARFIGAFIFVLFCIYIGWAIINRDWDLLKETLVFGGYLIAALSIIVGLAWALVKIFTRGRPKS